MQTATDWIALWRELASAHERKFKMIAGQGGSSDAWQVRARSFDQQVKQRWTKPDSSRDFVLSQLDPAATILDIGAGTGAWAILMARHCRSVTAVEPSPAMIEVLRENMAAEAILNIRIVQGSWPDVAVDPHDFSLCSQAMYGAVDLPAFVQRMMAVTRQTCFLVMRVPTHDGVMAQASQRIWGHPYDSPNFIVAYNVLLQMGIHANVLMENTGLWDPWINASLEEAFEETKRRFNVTDSDEHDEFLRDLLQRNLKVEGERCVWPRGVRSALVYWPVR